ncbi:MULTISPECIES: mechanosensitive ion channel family protein [Nonlabens]|uniref:Small conductance mechanosensitive channel n=1 Tax=Nonlabens xylanidelens TaxID=191564 RepID=A0A2S6INQ7_9FLAO|nr:mechanosensitive ion channel domain-containing protein [Nonlabens xylanidelens]PPK95892.1 small conductance mechanosensitive channel [Nonlabens xylanidelens]
MIQEPVVQADNLDLNISPDGFSLENITGYALEYGIPLLKAILIYIIGAFIIKKLVKVTSKLMDKRDYDVTLKKFLTSLLKWVLTILLIVTVAGTLGIETASFAAILAAAGLAIGLALQGSLSNFAGGVLILIFKPYKIGDLVEAQGELGVVKEIDILVTKLITPANKLALIPNGPMANGNIINYTAEGKMRVDTTVGIGYGEDMKQAKDALLAMLESNPKVLKDPAPSVNVSELAESSVNLAVRPYCAPEDYWDVYFWTIENTKLVLDREKIEIPYPHAVEIHKEA